MRGLVRHMHFTIPLATIDDKGIVPANYDVEYQSKIRNPPQAIRDAGLTMMYSLRTRHPGEVKWIVYQNGDWVAPLRSLELCKWTSLQDVKLAFTGIGLWHWACDELPGCVWRSEQLGRWTPRELALCHRFLEECEDGTNLAVAVVALVEQMRVPRVEVKGLRVEGLRGLKTWVEVARAVERLGMERGSGWEEVLE